MMRPETHALLREIITLPNPTTTLLSQNERVLIEFCQRLGAHIRDQNNSIALAAGVRATVAPTHRHKKRGTYYTLSGFGRLQSKQPIAEGCELYYYVGADGQGHMRPVYEFDDGRFQALPPAFDEPINVVIDYSIGRRQFIDDDDGA